MSMARIGTKTLKPQATLRTIPRQIQRRISNLIPLFSCTEVKPRDTGLYFSGLPARQLPEDPCEDDGTDDSHDDRVYEAAFRLEAKETHDEASAQGTD